jgi:hypothetical protein
MSRVYKNTLLLRGTAYGPERRANLAKEVLKDSTPLPQTLLYKDIDEEFKKWTAKLTKLHEKYSPFCQISFLFDKWELLDYKVSPVDKGVEVFMQLCKERVML